MAEQSPRKGRRPQEAGGLMDTLLAILRTVIQAILQGLRYLQGRRLFKSDVQGLLIVTAFMIIIGILNVYSATFAKNISNGTFLFSDVMKYIGFVIVSLLISIFVYRYDYRKLAKPNSKVLLYLVGGVVLSLLAVMVVGTVVNGARRWIQLGPVSIQPSEVAKLVGIVWASVKLSQFPWKPRYVSQRPKKAETSAMEDKLWDFFHFLGYSFKILWPILLFAAITLKQPDMGTALLIVGFPFLLMLLAGLETYWVKLIVPVAGALVLLTALISPYRRERVFTWWDPWQFESTSGYQTVQGMIAIGSGGLLGTGFGDGTSKFFYLPEAHTDFAFAVWAQEQGLVGALIIVALVVAMAFFGFRIARRCNEYLGALLATGCTMLLVGQAVFNIAMVCGMLPVTGVPLPFISYGGSALVVNMAAVALIANVGRRDALTPAIGKETDVSSHRDAIKAKARRERRKVKRLQESANS